MEYPVPDIPSATMEDIVALLQEPNNPVVWSTVLQLLRRLETSPLWRDSLTGMTALHFVVAAWNEATTAGRDDSATRADEWSDDTSASFSREQVSHRRQVIQFLLHQYPEATLVQCHAHRWTPLATALVALGQSGGSSEKGNFLIQRLLDTNPAALLLTDRRGRTPLCLLVQSASSFPMAPVSDVSTETKTELDEQQYQCDVFVTVLQTLVASATEKQLVDALESLYRGNTLTILNVTNKLLEQQATNGDENRTARMVQQLLDTCWVWQWVVILLSRIHELQQPPEPDAPVNKDAHHSKQESLLESPIDLLHVVSRIVDCPTLFCLWALMRDPSQVQSVDTDGNLPLHAVASWRYDSVTTTFNKCRKSMLLTSLVAAYPAAVKIKNCQGLDPIELEAASGAIIT